MNELLVRREFTGATLPDSIRAFLDDQVVLDDDEVVVSVNRKVPVAEERAKWDERLMELEEELENEALELGTLRD